MSLEKLSNEEKEIVFSSLRAILNGGFIDDEFQTRVGVEREELESIVLTHPNLDDSTQRSNVAIAINNCLNEVCNGIKFSQDEWSRWFGVSRVEVEAVYEKWRALSVRS